MKNMIIAAIALALSSISYAQTEFESSPVDSDITLNSLLGNGTGQGDGTFTSFTDGSVVIEETQVSELRGPFNVLLLRVETDTTVTISYDDVTDTYSAVGIIHSCTNLGGSINGCDQLDIGETRTFDSVVNTGVDAEGRQGFETQINIDTPLGVLNTTVEYATRPAIATTP